MRRDVTNPNRVIPTSQAWRDRKAGVPAFRTRGALRYARDQLTEWNGKAVPEIGERLRLSAGAQRLYGDLCNIALARGNRGLIDLTYAQLQVARGVPLVQPLDGGDSPAVDEMGSPIMVCAPEWGEGIRALQRQLRELQVAGFIEIGYVANRVCGGHRLCVNIGGPDWFLDEIRRIERLARSKGGRTSRPQQRRSPATGGDAGGSYSNPARYAGRKVDCDHCGGVGWVDRGDGAVERCNHGAARGLPGP